jgi:hypothetical protein
VSWASVSRMVKLWLPSVVSPGGEDQCVIAGCHGLPLGKAMKRWAARDPLPLQRGGVTAAVAALEGIS